MSLKRVVHSSWFSQLIIVVIMLNAILIGVQTSIDNHWVNLVQRILLIIFVIEIPLRWFGKDSVKEYVTNYWNWFDILIVGLALIPESLLGDASAISTLRVFRVFRVLRLFKVFPELQLMIRVLVRSIKSVFYAGFLLVIFMYIYAVLGVLLFEGNATVVTAHTNTIDPFGTVGEGFFSLFRVMTGEDWTDLRYDLLRSGCSVNPIVLNVYFVSWYILSAFLLINVVIGAVINNYEKVKREVIGRDREQQELLFRIGDLEDAFKKLTAQLEKQSADANDEIGGAKNGRA